MQIKWLQHNSSAVFRSQSHSSKHYNKADILRWTAEYTYIKTTTLTFEKKKQWQLYQSTFTLFILPSPPKKPGTAITANKFWISKEWQRQQDVPVLYFMPLQFDFKASWHINADNSLSLYAFFTNKIPFWPFNQPHNLYTTVFFYIPATFLQMAKQSWCSLSEQWNLLLQPCVT